MLNSRKHSESTRWQYTFSCAIDTVIGPRPSTPHGHISIFCSQFSPSLSPNALGIDDNTHMILKTFRNDVKSEHFFSPALLCLSEVWMACQARSMKTFDPNFLFITSTRSGTATLSSISCSHISVCVYGPCQSFLQLLADFRQTHSAFLSKWQNAMTSASHNRHNCSLALSSEHPFRPLRFRHIEATDPYSKGLNWAPNSFRVQIHGGCSDLD